MMNASNNSTINLCCIEYHIILLIIILHFQGTKLRYSSCNLVANSKSQKQAALRLPYKRVVELRLVEPELSTEHLSAYYIGFIACGLSCILFVLLAVIRFLCYHRSTHLIYNFTMTKVSAAKVRRKTEMRNTICTAFRITQMGYIYLK